MHQSEVYVVSSSLYFNFLMSGLEWCISPRGSTAGDLAAVTRSYAGSGSWESCFHVCGLLRNPNPFGQVSI